MKQIIIFIILGLLSCTKSEDMRNIRRLDERYKSYIPNINEKYGRIRTYYDTLNSIYDGFYFTSSGLYRSSAPCPTNYSCEYYETYYTQFKSGNGITFSYLGISSENNSNPYMSFSIDRSYRIYIKPDFSDFAAPYTKILDYTINGINFKNVYVFESDMYYIYYTKTDGLIKTKHKYLNQGYEVY